MTYFRNLLNAFVVLTLSFLATPLMAQDLAVERFAGSTRIGAQPGIPIHLELRRSGDRVDGTISIPGASFELAEAKGRDVITGRFRGEGGQGALTLRLAGDSLTGTFDFQGQPGTITAERTTESAEAFFRPPAENLVLSSAEWLEDLDRLAAILTKDHAAPFHRISRAQFEHEVTKLRAAIPAFEGTDVALEFRKLGASIGDGHTSVALPSSLARLPIEFYWFEDGLRVVAISSDHSALLGARLIAVNGVPADVVTERMRSIVPQGETQAYHRANVANLLNSPAILRVAGVGERTPVELILQAMDGRDQRIEVATADGPGELVTLGGSVPLWQQNEEQGFWSEWLAGDALYVNWRSYDDLAKHSAALLQTLDEKHPRRLIIDLRDNSGGDFNAGRTFIEEIRERPWLDRQGALYVMIGRKTFSAAMTNAIDFKQTTKAILVGETAGAAPNNWQEVKRVYLPNSGLRVGVSTRFYEFLPGNDELRPDHEVLPEPQDWGRQVDAATSFILAQPVP